LSYKGLILDTNLLLLFVVGSTSQGLISKHKRLRAYSETDFDLLTELISCAPNVIVTPNTLTETSNLIGYIDEPARTRIFEGFRALIQSSDEHYCESRQAVARKEFIRLGLTDSVLLHETADSFTLLTADLDLYLAAAHAGYQVQNFNHLREMAYE
jgi:hypothetical protein